MFQIADDVVVMQREYGSRQETRERNPYPVYLVVNEYTPENAWDDTILIPRDRVPMRPIPVKPRVDTSGGEQTDKRNIYRLKFVVQINNKLFWWYFNDSRIQSICLKNKLCIYMLLKMSYCWYIYVLLCYHCLIYIMWWCDLLWNVINILYDGNEMVTL